MRSIEFGFKKTTKKIPNKDFELPKNINSSLFSYYQIKFEHLIIPPEKGKFPEVKTRLYLPSGLVYSGEENTQYDIHYPIPRGKECTSYLELEIRLGEMELAKLDLKPSTTWGDRAKKIIEKDIAIYRAMLFESSAKKIKFTSLKEIKEYSKQFKYTKKKSCCGFLATFSKNNSFVTEIS